MSALSERQVEVLQLMAEGYTHGEVAKKLFLSEAVVKTDLASVREKLDARNTTHAVAIAFRAGLLDLAEGAAA